MFARYDTQIYPKKNPQTNKCQIYMLYKLVYPNIHFEEKSYRD